MTYIEPPDKYTDHSAEVEDWEDSQGVWYSLSNFWDLMDNKGLVTVFWKGWDYILNRIKMYLDQHKYDFSFHSDSYLMKLEPLQEEFVFDDNISGDIFFIDEKIRDIVSVKDFIQSPSLTYLNEETAPNAAHTFKLSTSMIRGEKGIIEFSDDDYNTCAWGDGSIRMWVSYVPKMNEEIVDKFGPFVDYEDTHKNEIDTVNVVNSLMYAQQYGPTIPNLRSALYLYCDWPYSPSRGTVTAISGRDYVIITNTNGVEKTVTNNLGIEFLKETRNDGWRPLEVGDSVAVYEPLVNAVEIEDIVTDPTYWTKIPLGKYERFHTFSVLLNGDATTGYTTNGGEPNYDLIKIGRLLDRHKPIGDKPFIDVILPNMQTEATSWSHWRSENDWGENSSRNYSNPENTIGLDNIHNRMPSVEVSGNYTSFDIPPQPIETEFMNLNFGVVLLAKGALFSYINNNSLLTYKAQGVPMFETTWDDLQLGVNILNGWGSSGVLPSPLVVNSWADEWF